MELMEEGNLMDRIPILIQRDMEYYQQNQVVLQETMCPGVVGGKLDFPRYASFASVKLVLWFEDEYFAAYKKNSGLLQIDSFNEGNENEMTESPLAATVIVKNSDPLKWVSLVTKSTDKLLDHLHTLSQEALDHADLSVLTATIGAASLLKNVLWVYLQNVTVHVCPPKGDEEGGSLKISHRQYSELTEALAERLLDLHCRLLTLYILQDADSLNWDDKKSFFESERGSYTIQMWWLYLQGTKEDLWNSVPPKMSQDVLSGIINETLSVLTVRYTQVVPSQARSQLLLVDICNILFCMSDLMPSLCENGEALMGMNITHFPKTIRDIHTKCNELFICLLFRGAPLGTLFKVLKKNSKVMFRQNEALVSPWIKFAYPKLFPRESKVQERISSDLMTNSAICVDFLVLINAPQADWPLLIKCLLMRDAKLSKIILKLLLDNLPTDDNFIEALHQPMNSEKLKKKCTGFMCGLECTNIALWAQTNTTDPVQQTNYQVVLALCFVLITVGKPKDIQHTLIEYLEGLPNRKWADCLDRRQVWSQKRPPWFEALVNMINPILDPIVHMLLSAVQTGSATRYQSMSLAISCFSEMWDCLPECIYRVTHALMEIMPTDIRPLGDNVLIQVLFAALYSKLLKVIQIAEEDKVANAEKIAHCQRLAEAICFVDEDNKHTDQLANLLKQANETILMNNLLESQFNDSLGISMASTIQVGEVPTSPSPSMTSGVDLDVENANYISKILASDIFATKIGKQTLKVIYGYVKNNRDWILVNLGQLEGVNKESRQLMGQNLEEPPTNLLHQMFHIGSQPFDALLTDNVRIDYNYWLQTALGVTPERVWLQVSKRFEFQNTTQLNLHDTAMVAFISKSLKGELEG